MKCKHARKVLADHVNEVLESEDSRLVQEHVAECDSCRRELDMLRKVLKLTDDVKVEYPPASVWENFLRDLHRRIEAEAALAFREQQRQRLYLLPGWAASVAAVVLILAASFSFKAPALVAIVSWYVISGPLFLLTRKLRERYFSKPGELMEVTRSDDRKLA